MYFHLTHSKAEPWERVHLCYQFGLPNPVGVSCVIVCTLSCFLVHELEKRYVTTNTSLTHEMQNNAHEAKCNAPTHGKHMSIACFFGRQLSSTKELNQHRFATIVSQKTDRLRSLGLFH